MTVTRTTDLLDESGDYHILWNLTGAAGVMMQMSDNPIACTSYDQQMVVDGKMQLDAPRTITNRDYHELIGGTATLVNNVIQHNSTDLSGA